MSKRSVKLGLKHLTVKYQGRAVGNLALTQDGRCAFSYDENWLKTGFSISPFSLPLIDNVFVPTNTCFDGLFGIFADSLPDAWGRLLLERMLKVHEIKGDVTTLDRLAMIGSFGMGALEYEPDYRFTDAEVLENFDDIAAECKKILNTEYSDKLDGLYKLGGSSGGARPKILTTIGDKDWIIKFPAHVDSMDIGFQEYRYSLCAKKCGIEMTETKLFPSDMCKGYFGTVRFDVETASDGTKRRVHTATAAALLEADFRAPCLDYHELMKLTRILTRDDKKDVENMFRRACFNVFAHNRDDHAKNFTFLYDDKFDRWHLSPAYDLTYSNTYWGEHTTSVDGNGANPGIKELLNVGIKAGLKRAACEDIISEISNIVSLNLKEYV